MLNTKYKSYKLDSYLIFNVLGCTDCKGILPKVEKYTIENYLNFSAVNCRPVIPFSQMLRTVEMKLNKVDAKRIKPHSIKYA